MAPSDKASGTATRSEGRDTDSEKTFLHDISYQLWRDMDRLFVGSVTTMVAAACSAFGYIELAYDPPAVETWNAHEEASLLSPDRTITFDVRLYYETHELLISPAHAIGVASKFLSSPQQYLADRYPQLPFLLPLNPVGGWPGGPSFASPPHPVEFGSRILSEAPVQILRRAASRLESVAMGSPTFRYSGLGPPVNDLNAAFRRNMGALRACYAIGLRDNPALRGQAVINFTIGTNGRVIGTPDVGGLNDAERVRQCIAARVRTYVFPMLADAAHVSFRVVLSPHG